MKWALFRELYGPSKFAKKFKTETFFRPIHEILYNKGPVFKTANIIIPVMNLEIIFCEIWANISVKILTTDPLVKNGKIIIDERLLKLCFKMKIMFSYSMFQNNGANFKEILEKGNILVIM